MKADGFSLDDKRQPVKDNDIPEIIKQYRSIDWSSPLGENEEGRKGSSFFVPVDEIRQNDYDLSINKYKEIERVKVEYEPVSELLSQLDRIEAEYVKGYDRLAKMLEK